ncbi:unnamed protein product [Protopolystoma xenopodis]|uniref:Uncharacterized protein n=1 Tax=Protopolystoma xenopodis TaxID=117903 RepID=A0A3S5CTN4_9PLAT|nr:unnamed protein product [Protopolystoma xenopodis]
MLSDCRKLLQKFSDSCLEQLYPQLLLNGKAQEYLTAAGSFSIAKQLPEDLSNTRLGGNVGETVIQMPDLCKTFEFSENILAGIRGASIPLEINPISITLYDSNLHEIEISDSVEPFTVFISKKSPFKEPNFHALDLTNTSVQLSQQKTASDGSLIYQPLLVYSGMQPDGEELALSIELRPEGWKQCAQFILVVR